jgi:hypothetical protein
MKRPREVIQARWGVYVLKKRTEHYRPVQAKSERDALECAIKEYEVPERERWHLSVQREA